MYGEGRARLLAQPERTGFGRLGKYAQIYCTLVVMALNYTSKLLNEFYLNSNRSTTECERITKRPESRYVFKSHRAEADKYHPI